MIEIYRLADRLIRIASDNERLHKMCEDYRADGQPDFSVSASFEDIAFEREQSDREAAAEGREPRAWSDAYLETLAVYRQIAERMPAYRTFLFHGSAVAVDGWGYLFAARSGTGKSTHARLWQQLLGDRLVYVNDDKPLVRITDQAALVYGTPYDGKHHLSSNIAVPLRALCLLQRGAENSIRPIGAREAFPRLMQQVYCPKDREAFARTMELIQELTRQVRFYELSCNMDLEAAQVAFQAMGGGTL